MCHDMICIRCHSEDPGGAIYIIYCGLIQLFSNVHYTDFDILSCIEMACGYVRCRLIGGIISTAEREPAIGPRLRGHAASIGSSGYQR